MFDWKMFWTVLGGLLGVVGGLMLIGYIIMIEPWFNIVILAALLIVPAIAAGFAAGESR